MTVQLVNAKMRQDFLGISTDAKPAAPAGSEFFELDTGLTYKFDGSAWQLKYTLVQMRAGGAFGKFRVNAAAGINQTSVKKSPGSLFGWNLFNNTASARYVKLFDKASAPIIGADAVDDCIIIPANGGSNVYIPPTGANGSTPTGGIPYFNGIGFAITAGQPDTDTTVVAAGDVQGQFLYV